MKKLIYMLLAFSLLLALTGCGHTHTGGDWEMDSKEHWKTCECGEKCEVGEHTTDDMSYCTGCGAEVFVWDDGAGVSLYDDHGNLIHSVSYDAQGDVAADIRIEYTYDDQGNLRSEMRYIDDVLVQECAYENGILTTDISYLDDGSYHVTVYEECAVSIVSYDASGKRSAENYCEYAYDADGNMYEKKNIVVDADTIKTVCEYDENGELLSKTIYDAEGNVIE